jgi:hypothetical protein
MHRLRNMGKRRVPYRLDPQMTDDEIRYFEAYLQGLPKKARLVEWGAGGSTAMFLEHLKPHQTLISIEHNPEWFRRVSEALSDHPRRNRLTLLYVQPKENAFHHGASPHGFWGYGHPLEENPAFLEEYIDPELASEFVRVFDADVFLVDGIARGACLAAIRLKARADADVFIHDYRSRETWYDWAVDLYSRRAMVSTTLLKLTI